MRDLGKLVREYAQLERARTAVGLPPEQVRRWKLLKEQLDRHFSPGADPGSRGQRASVRVPTRIKVSFAVFGSFQTSIMTNLSRGGVFISTSMPLEFGETLELKIHVAEEGELRVPCRVVSTSVGRGFDTQQMGMGLAFMEMDAEQRRRLDDLYEHALRRHAPDEAVAEVSRSPRRSSA